MISSTVGKGINTTRIGSSNLNSELAVQKRELEESLLTLQQSILALELDLFGSDRETSLEATVKELKDLAKNIDSFIKTNEEQIFEDIDSKRMFLENYLGILKISVNQQLLPLKNIAEGDSINRAKSSERFTNYFEEIVTLFEEEIEKFKEEDIYENIANISFKEAAAPPVGLIDLGSSFQGLSSPDEGNLSSFRNWKLGAAFKANIARTERVKIRAKISNLIGELERFVSSLEEEEKDSLFVFGLKQLTNLIKKAPEDINNNLLKMREDRQLRIYQEIAKRLTEKLDKTLADASKLFEVDLKQALANSIQTPELRAKIEVVRGQLEEKERLLAELQTED